MTGSKLLDVGDQNVRALHHLHGVAGVAHVAAGQAEMEPAAGVVVDFLGDGGGEADDVVVERFFPVRAGGRRGRAGRRTICPQPALILAKSARGHDAFGDERLAGEQFDLQPDAELVFVRPDGPHFRAGIARNHGTRVKVETSKR